MAPFDRAGPGRVAVIGAGMAGAACGSVLAEAGLSVDIFEKERGVGGRMATRRTPAAAFDYGAQYATARGPAFQAFIDRLIGAGGAAPWAPRVRDVRLADDDVERHDPWFVGTPGMNALVKPLTAPAAIHKAVRVTGIARGPNGWFLALASGPPAGPFAAVAVTAPAPQTLALLGGLDSAFERIGHVGMSPCWTVAATFDKPLGIGADVVRPGRTAITWSARNSAKPGRAHGPETWVIHGNPVWSLDHLEDDPAAVAAALLDALAEATGDAVPADARVETHRWRHARVERSLGRSHLLGTDGTLGAAGDWCLGARVESAFNSGRALGQALSARLRAA